MKIYIKFNNISKKSDPIFEFWESYWNKYAVGH